MIRLDLTDEEFASLLAHFGVAVNARMHRPAAHHHLELQNLPAEVHIALTAKLIEAMKEVKNRLVAEKNHA